MQTELHKNKSIGVALGGGGMKGLAHIGAISVLEQHGICPNVIAGTSMGALVGAFYACGLSADALRLRFSDYTAWELLSPRLDGKGLIGVSGLQQFLEEMLPIKTFEALPIPFHVVCTDVETGNEVVLSEGSIIEAVLASTAIPGVFAPVQVGGHWLIDGGIYNNLPVSVLKKQGVSKSIAIRLFNPKTAWHLFGNPEEDIDGDGEISFSEQLLSRLIRKTPLALRTSERAIELMIGYLENLMLQQYPPDILIEPKVEDISIVGFANERTPIFERGVAAAMAFSALLSTYATLQKDAV